MAHALDLAQLRIADTVSSGKGKSAQISYGGQPVHWRPGALQVAFEPGAFNGEPASRVNLVFRATAVQEALDALDAWIVDYVTANSERILGKQMSGGEVQTRYHPCLKKSDKYEPTFKCKVNMEAPNQVRLWDVDKKPREAPKAWKDLMVAPQLRLKGLWLMGRDFGCLWEATDLMFEDVAPGALQCPF